jgi:hypothetical protein
MKLAQEAYQNMQIDLKKNVHEQGFTDVYNLISEFVDKASDAVTSAESPIHWVADSAPGQGKTTALIAYGKATLKTHKPIPLLFVFNNKKALETVFHELQAHAIQLQRPKAVQYVNEDNVERVSEDLDEYRILCITHQRLRNLYLGFGEKNDYLRFMLPFEKLMPRHIIIDEIPIFVNESIFDIGSRDNCVAWFDVLASQAALNESDIQFARALIMELFNMEIQSERNNTIRLVESIEFTGKDARLEEILEQLSDVNADRESTLQLKWFLDLYRQDHVGVIEKTKVGSRIICAGRLDYRELERSILILDGTSGITSTIYNGEYEYKQLRNYHNYHRLNLYHRVVGTSKEARDYAHPSEIIADDIRLIRKDMNVFPLMNKNDINTYRNNQVILDDQADFFDDPKSFEQGSSYVEAISLLNTTGKNVLNEYHALALLNMPIRSPIYYKQMAISIFGTEIDVSTNDGNHSSWFKDERVEALYKEMVLADFVQIIHRCKLRNVNDSSSIHVYLYTKHPRWILLLQDHFALPKANVKKKTLQSNYHEEFIQKSLTWAEKAKHHCLNDKFTNPFGQSYTARSIAGVPFKDWLNKEWKNDERQQLLTEIFRKCGLGIEVVEKGSIHEKRIYLLDNEMVAVGEPA